MRTVKITLEYDGTGFNGWQIQARPNRTVQGEIESVLKKIFKKNVRCIGSGRTDSGVHALGQVAHFKVATRMNPEQILKALNSNLPQDIAVHAACFVRASFHARFAAKRKTYRYVILNRPVASALERNHCWHIRQRLNLTAMRRAAKDLVGRKDFRSFTASDTALGSRGKNTVRRISRLDIRKKKDFILIEIEADGFLYKMVRNIAGTLVEVGLNRLSQGLIKDILRRKNRGCAAITAPAQGLFLVNVTY